jgi:hypothetical protein
VAHPSDSLAQRNAESVLRGLLEHRLGMALQTRRIDLGEDACVEVDGVNTEQRVICEIYCRIGRLLPAQKKKIAADILKLMVTERVLAGRWRKILCFADAGAAGEVRGRSWLAKAVALEGIEILVLDLPAETRASIVAAQARQVMINKEEIGV